MATINLTGVTVTSGVPSPVGPLHAGIAKHYVMSAKVDLSAYTLVAADIYQLLAIPANTLVRNVKVKMVTPAVGTTLTGNFGDGAGADSWDAAVDLKGTAGTWTTSLVGTDAYAAAAAQGKFYSADDTIDLTLATVTAITSSPVFEIYAECIDFNRGF